MELKPFKEKLQIKEYTIYMNTSKSIDIIIPSFRLEEEFLLPLINLPKPATWIFNYYIIVDNPVIKVPHGILELSRENNVHLYINEENLGASASRNKGIDAGRGNWVLFLDDDVVAEKNLLFTYTRAIENHPNEIGFIGLTDFPPSTNKFTKALQANELTFFKIAEEKEYFPWGVTANMMYNRADMQDIRFSSIFPKSGGGEDVDFPLRICQKHNKEFKCLKEAKVIHPWWNDGNPHYDRFVRYGSGVGYLFPLHKELVWRDFPNTVESLLLMIVLAPFFIAFGQAMSWLIILIAIPVFEFIVVYLKARKMNIKSLKIIYYIALLKNCFSLGMLKTVIEKQQLQYFMSRINIGAPTTHNFRLNRWKIIKLSLFAILFMILLMTQLQ